MAEWKKMCGSGQCVEVRSGATVEVRATGRPDVVAAFEPEVWRAFLGLVRAGGVDG